MADKDRDLKSTRSRVSKPASGKLRSHGFLSRPGGSTGNAATDSDGTPLNLSRGSRSHNAGKDRSKPEALSTKAAIRPYGGDTE